MTLLRNRGTQQVPRCRSPAVTFAAALLIIGLLASTTASVRGSSHADDVLAVPEAVVEETAAIARGNDEGADRTPVPGVEQAGGPPPPVPEPMEVLPKAKRPVLKLSAHRAKKAATGVATKAAPEYHPHGRTFPRRADWESQRLISGQPDAWFRAILRTEPDDLTLDQVEDMTIDERTDYVGMFSFAHHREHANNIVLHLLRLEQLGRMYNRKRPGEDDADDPFHDAPEAPMHTVSRVKEQDQEREVPDEDRRMSSPRWHLDGERERIEADPVWTRRTVRRRPLPQNVFVPVSVTETDTPTTAAAGATANRNGTEANGTAANATQQSKRRAVVTSLAEATKVKPEYDPKHTTSTVPRVPTVKRTTRGQRAARRRQMHAEMTEEERLVEWMKDDPARCLTAAADFCDGISSRYAEFMDCALANKHKFKPHDAYCAEELPFFEPCRADMLAHCPNQNSLAVTNCLLVLAGDAADAIAQRGVAAVEEGASAEGEPQQQQRAALLSPECLASEHMETVALFRPPERSGHAGLTLSEDQRKILFKYQHFWLAQHGDPAAQDVEPVDPEEFVSRFDIVSSDEL